MGKLSVERLDELMRLVFNELKLANEPLRPKDVLARVEPKANLTEHERQANKTGGYRWETHIRFYTTDCYKAGFIDKTNGYWSLTEKGQQALALPKGQLIREAMKAYRASKKGDQTPPNEFPPVPEGIISRQSMLEKAREDARAAIDGQIDSLDPYEFQNFVAELLTAMGYHVRHNAPPGPDGGVDILAYRDPLGTIVPRIKVQVKHRKDRLNVKEVRELAGLLHKEGDIGLLVSSGGYTSDAEREILSSGKHIEKMDRDRLISLWIQYYDKLSEAGRSLLPLIPVYFLAPLALEGDSEG